MTTSPPQVNGHRSRIPVITDWQTLLAPAEEPAVTTTPEPDPVAPAVDLVAQAKADAIRTKAYADAEEQRIRAEAEAKAAELKAAEEARKLKLANDKAAARALEEQAARDARIAESERKRAEAERGQQEDERAHQEQQQTAAAAEADVAKAAKTWRRYAIFFYTVCAVVALPVQIAAFWDRDAPWLVIAPLMLEGAALVVTKGAAAAVAAGRPHWHYRTVAWAFAFIAAGINLKHGLDAFDPATAIGTAFASLAGPGVWDLHEHGRIRRRDGVPTRRERRAAKKTAEREAAEQTQARLVEAERQAHLENAARNAAERLDADRKQMFPRVHEHALKLAADLGETAITPAIWKQAKLDVDGALPGESDEILRMRNTAAAKVEAARLNKPVSTLSKTTNAQRAAHLPPASTKPRPKPIPPRRTRGDSTPFHPAAKRLAADTARRSMTVRINAEEN
ncbi:hypothetical protein ACZ90_04585 [Streptomyces albus subsp. albus]|uniref:DUF2637 domain-containing protein n=1 Tax=Streptomyces TaxID=1883 RepID=UPI0004BDCE77|nr:MULTISPECIES: DUF2637 domain-containing protein [Streptomyces]KOG78721.1 hypothetical protein ADK33_25740 [Streptomyces griseus subsp. rhodochrous]KUJ70342.1 hypothetical protein ACZ90_04585 [Streptomyces albus subsp. albus]